MDPAGPLFLDRGLNKTCAQYVQVIHVSKLLGKFANLGHIDYYANNKSVQQTGCLDDICSHLKVVFFNYASLFSENEFTGRECNSQDSPNATTSRFGLFSDGKQEGSYCFNTSACFPYTLFGSNGVVSLTNLSRYSISSASNESQKSTDIGANAIETIIETPTTNERNDETQRQSNNKYYIIYQVIKYNGKSRINGRKKYQRIEDR